MRDHFAKVVRRVLLPSYGTRSRWRYKTRDCLAVLLFIRGRTHFPWHGPIIPRTQLLLAPKGLDGMNGRMDGWGAVGLPLGFV